MNGTLKKQIKKSLALALSDIKNTDETFKFLEDFLTEKEFENLAKRLSVAYWLTKKRNYANIQNNLNVSTRTIAEGRELLKRDSIKKAVKNLDADEWAEKWSSQLRKLHIFK
jgi:uncharacterized protein YerC